MLRCMYIACLLVLGVHVAVNNINVLIVVTEMQQWVPCALLTSHKIFHTSVTSIKVLPITALVARNARCVCYTPYYIVTCGLPLSTIFFHIIS